jgi:hypothetical protein
MRKRTQTNKNNDKKAPPPTPRTLMEGVYIKGKVFFAGVHNTAQTVHPLSILSEHSIRLGASLCKSPNLLLIQPQTLIIHKFSINHADNPRRKML